MGSAPNGFVEEARSAFSFLATEFGLLPVDVQYAGRVTWQSSPRRVDVTWDNTTQVHVVLNEDPIDLKLVLWLQRVRRDRASSRLDPLALLRYRAELTRQHAGLWLHGDRAAFTEARELRELRADWRMESFQKEPPRSIREYRRIEHLWITHDYAGIVALLEGLTTPLTSAEQRGLQYAQRRIASTPDSATITP